MFPRAEAAVFVLLVSVLALPALAADIKPTSLVYQGRLTLADGTPLGAQVSKQMTMRFTFYDVDQPAPETLPLCTWTVPAVKVTDGYFRTEIGLMGVGAGDCANLQALVASQGHLWMELAVMDTLSGQFDPMSPLIRVGAAPRAHHAQFCERAPILMTGQEKTVDEGNPAVILWKNTTANPTVKLTLVGGRYNTAHYTEMPFHSHAAAAESALGTHNHSASSGNMSQDHVHAAGHGHGHGLSVASGGSHSHSVSGGSHKHTIGSASGSAGSLAVCDGCSPVHTDKYCGYGSISASTNLAGSHSHSLSGSVSNVSFNTGGASANHNHAITVANTDLAHVHKIVVNAIGVASSLALSAMDKTWFSGLQVWVDGVDRTADVLALAEANYPGKFANLGDGTQGHRLNNTDLASPGPGTGEMDISAFVPGAGFHRIELRQEGAAGGAVSWFLEVR